MAEKKYTDFTSGSKAAVMALMNASNNTSFSDTQVDLQDVVIRESARLATVTAVAKQFSGYSGTVSLDYNRVELSEIPDVEAGLTEYDLTKYSGLFAYFMDMHNVNMDTTDITVNGVDVDSMDTEVVQEYDVPIQFVIAAKPESFAWFGSVTLEIMRTRMKLSDVWQVTVLDGLYAPVAQFRWPVDIVAHRTMDGGYRKFQDGTIKQFVVKAAD